MATRGTAIPDINLPACLSINCVTAGKINYGNQFVTLSYMYALSDVLILQWQKKGNDLLISLTYTSFLWIVSYDEGVLQKSGVWPTIRTVAEWEKGS